MSILSDYVPIIMKLPYLFDNVKFIHHTVCSPKPANSPISHNLDP
jgi:hypothetical protein